MQLFASWPLYRFTGSDEPSKVPPGFMKTPDLETYLNHLAQGGYCIFQVVATTDQMWYTILTVTEHE